MQPQSTPTYSPSPEELAAFDKSVEAFPTGLPPIHPMIELGLATYRREVPELLKKYAGQWVAYHGDKRLGFNRNRTKLVLYWIDRGIPNLEMLTRVVAPLTPEDLGEDLED